MESLQKDLYEDFVQLMDMATCESFEAHGGMGTLYRANGEYGKGEYWTYFHGNLFAVNDYEMTFSRNVIMRHPHAEHLSIVYYEDTRDFVQMGRCTSPGTVDGYVAEDGAEYMVRLVPGSYVRGTSITISPDYYRSYLQERFGDIPDVRRALSRISGRRDVPELVELFRRIHSYEGRGTAAELFYEGAVSEAIALVLEKAEELDRDGSCGHDEVAAEDRRALAQVDAYIRANLSAAITVAGLAQVACMGQTKFKQTFRRVYGTTPASYIADVRMQRASELLRTTSLPIAHIAAQVGYRKPGAFTEAFRKRTGLVPSALR